MAIRVGINGFGRIGRQVLRAAKQQGVADIDFVAVNDLTDTKTLAHLFKYDSVHRTYQGDVSAGESSITVDGDEIKVFAEKDPAALPWKDLGVDIVLESTGRFTNADGARKHLDGGAKKVIISAPAKGEDLTIVLGVNDNLYNPGTHHVVSNASCTTNCLAPAAKIVNDRFKIQSAVMTTIHSYTNDQVILDQGHKKEMRRSRAAAQNIIPTSTGAAKAVALVIPELKGKFDGASLRVPTPTVSIIDFVIETEKNASADSVNDAFRAAAQSEQMQGILGYSDEPLVSSDFRGDSRSAVVDGLSTMALGDNLVKVLAWYDNEWAYACRVAELVALICEQGIDTEEDE